MSSFIKLSDIAKLTVGFVGTMAPHYEESGIPFLRSLNIKPFQIDNRDLKYISREFADKISKSTLHTDDVVIVRTGIPGTCCVVPQEFDESNCSDVVIVHPNKAKVNPHFLAAYINYWGKYQIQNSKVGAIQQHFNVHSAENLLIFLPSIERQNKVASIATSINSKLEINNRISAELEAMAKMLYDYWFVQFDFPDENGKPYRASGGEMVWNDELKREIPKGWIVGPLSNIADIVMGQSPSGDSYNENQEGIIFYQGCTDFGIRFPVPRMYTTAPTRFAKKNDILLSVRAPVGSLNFTMEDCCIGRGLSALRSKLGSQLHLFYTLLQLKQFFDVANSNGTTFGSITKDMLYNLQVVIPPKAIVDSFETICSSGEKKIITAETESRELTRLRDWLLPMLMNGQAWIEE